MDLRTCPICGTSFTPAAVNQIYDKVACKGRGERRRRRSRESRPPADEHGLFTTLTNVTLEDLENLQAAYWLTKSQQPSRIIGPLPDGWTKFEIVPEYGTENHMFLP